jgi:hypothetical protein
VRARIRAGFRGGAMAAKSAEARKVLRDLDKELADASSRQGRILVWSAQEATILGQIASLLDRKAEFSSLYDEAPDTKTKLKISAELRLIEQAVARLVRLVKTDLAQPESMTTVKARKAARRRWDRDAAS